MSWTRREIPQCVFSMFTPMREGEGLYELAEAIIGESCREPRDEYKIEAWTKELVDRAGGFLAVDLLGAASMARKARYASVYKLVQDVSC